MQPSPSNHRGVGELMDALTHKLNNVYTNAQSELKVNLSNNITIHICGLAIATTRTSVLPRMDIWSPHTSPGRSGQPSEDQHCHPPKGMSSPDWKTQNECPCPCFRSSAVKDEAGAFKVTIIFYIRHLSGHVLVKTELTVNDTVVMKHHHLMDQVTSVCNTIEKDYSSSLS